RFDWSDRARDAALTDKGGSLVLTYWPSEFAQLRGQFRRTHYAENIDTNELRLQLQFAIGAHGAHPFYESSRFIRSRILFVRLQFASRWRIYWRRPRRQKKSTLSPPLLTSPPSPEKLAATKW